MTPQERMQEIANRGIQDRLPTDKRAIFDEAAKRGLITLPETNQSIERQRGSQAASNKESLVDKVIGGVDAAGSIARKIVAEPISGIAGIQATMLGGPKIGNVVREGVSQGLGFNPVTDQGKESLAKVGETLAPIGEKINQAENFLGNKAFEATGSPALAAAAETIPTLATEVLGFGLTKGGLKTASKVSRSSDNKSITKAIREASPSTDQLKQTSRAIYKEIDDLGVKVKPESYTKMVSKLEQSLLKEGLDTSVDNLNLTPKSFRMLQKLKSAQEEGLTISDIDRLRKSAKAAATSNDAADASLGKSIITELDNFLDNASEGSLVGENVGNIGARYKSARDLWGRAKRSEALDEAVEQARFQASGFENGIRIQFRQIIKSKNKSRFFSKEELAEMEKVVNGSKGANLTRLFGKLGYTDGQTSNIIGGALGSTAGGVVGGTTGAVLVPLIGIASKRFAERLTRKNATFANQVVRAGKDARKITQVYFKNTSPKLRNADELSELLLRNDIDLSKIPDSEIAKEAARIASQRRTSLGVAVTSGSAASQSLEK